MSARITIDLDDVREHGSVAEAIKAACPEDIFIADASAMGGQTFATSGPGPGWSRQLGAPDYARVSIREDSANSGGPVSECECLDPQDGRIARGVDPDGDEEWDGQIEWDHDSCVCLDCPSDDDGIAHPIEVAMMAQEVIEHHRAESDCPAWRSLIERIRTAAAAFVDIDVEELA